MFLRLHLILWDFFMYQQINKIYCITFIFCYMCIMFPVCMCAFWFVCQLACLWVSSFYSYEGCLFICCIPPYTYPRTRIAVSIILECKPEGQGSISDVTEIFCPSPQHPNHHLRPTQPLSQWIQWL
jgi:hypothetical protein